MLTEYQAGQLLYVHFEGDFKYRTDAGTRVPSAQWRKMVSALVDGGYVSVDRNGVKLTDRGRQYLDEHHAAIKPLS